MALGVGMLFVKDFLDEYRPSRCLLLENKRTVVRWAASIITFVLIMLCGVFSADQFIYAKF